MAEKRKAGADDREIKLQYRGHRSHAVDHAIYLAHNSCFLIDHDLPHEKICNCGWILREYDIIFSGRCSDQFLITNSKNKMGILVVMGHVLISLIAIEHEERVIKRVLKTKKYYGNDDYRKHLLNGIDEMLSL